MALRKAKTDDDLSALDRVLMTSFSIQSSWAQWMERVGKDNLRVALESGRVIGGVGFYRMAEYFGGRSVPLAGVAGVGIALDMRGRGHAKKMCGDLLVELAAEGMPLAGLYASTTTLYRSIGFEQAGMRIAFRAPPSSFAPGSHDLPCRELDPNAWQVFEPLYTARAKTWTGHLDRTPAIWERTVQTRPGLTVHAYALGDPMEGYVIFHQAALDTRWFDVRIRDWVLSTPGAAARMRALFADLAALTRYIEWSGCAQDGILSILPEQKQEVIASERWMLRILDVGRALELRGYPPIISGEVHLRVRDALLGANEGDFVVRVENGKANVRRGGRGDVKLDIRALAAMYSGFAHPSSMIAAGLLEGDASMLAALFAGPAPWCCDHY